MSASHLEGLPVVDELLGDGVPRKVPEADHEGVVVGVERGEVRGALLGGQLPHRQVQYLMTGRGGDMWDHLSGSPSPLSNTIQQTSPRRLLTLLR